MLLDILALPGEGPPERGREGGMEGREREGGREGGIEGREGKEREGGRGAGMLDCMVRELDVTVFCVLVTSFPIVTIR